MSKRAWSHSGYFACRVSWRCCKRSEKRVLLMKVVCKETGELLGGFASVSRVGEKNRFTVCWLLRACSGAAAGEHASCGCIAGGASPAVNQGENMAVSGLCWEVAIAKSTESPRLEKDLQEHQVQPLTWPIAAVWCVACRKLRKSTSWVSRSKPFGKKGNCANSPETPPWF